LKSFSKCSRSQTRPRSAPPRRSNSARNYLDGAKLIQPLKALNSGPWVMVVLRVTDYMRRFVRDHG